MEITSLGEAGINIVDLGDIAAPAAPQAHNDDLEVLDLPGLEVVNIPGATMPGLPGAAPAVEKAKTWKEDGDHSKFLDEWEKEVEAIPAHTGQTTVGIERAIEHLKNCNSEISKAIRTDKSGKVDEIRAERLREKIWDQIDRLEQAHATLMEAKSKKRRKAASVRVGKEVVARIQNGSDITYYVEVSQGDRQELLPVSLAEPTDDQVQLFVKGEAEAGLEKTAATGRIVLYVDPFMQALSRILIAAHVSSGRDIEIEYDKLRDKYALTKREELGLQELLLQKGMPIVKDFGRTGEDGGQDSDGNGVEANTNYYA